MDQVTAREHAIETFRRTFNDAEKITAEGAADLVDALIAAARAPESDHTRAMRELTQKEASAAVTTAARRVLSEQDREREEFGA